MSSFWPLQAANPRLSRCTSIPRFLHHLRCSTPYTPFSYASPPPLSPLLFSNTFHSTYSSTVTLVFSSIRVADFILIRFFLLSPFQAALSSTILAPWKQFFLRA
uniref:Uncharacterized protein n=1 Tax=Guillardia theta TaxID=55529 RepID=A0A6U6BCU0_GUITH